MESNYTFEDFKKEVIRRENAKKDLVAPTNRITMLNDGTTIELENEGQYTAQENFHGQLANHLGIPKRYYDEMSAIPSLRAENVNAWLGHLPNGSKKHEERMIRTMDGKARAFMSAKFRPFDNAFAIQAMSPVFETFPGNVEIKASSLTDLRMYLQIVVPTLKADVVPGDTVQYGIVITNSEVGRGALDISSLIWRLKCTNGMIGESILNRRHVGSKINFETEDVNIYQHDTIKAELESYRLRVRDVIQHALSESEFEYKVKLLQAANTDEMPKKKAKDVIVNVTKKFNMNEEDIDSIFANLASENNYSRYGLANAVTALAHESDPDKAYDYEITGNKIITLSPKDWRVLADAA
jgi:hypothetical protein